LEAVDVLEKLPGDFYTNIAATKWQDRKAALEALLAIAKVPKVADNKYHELISTLGKVDYFLLIHLRD
jgi:cytoskeleton-associated protein 5